jgi:hypothetical protein
MAIAEEEHMVHRPEERPSSMGAFAAKWERLASG